MKSWPGKWEVVESSDGGPDGCHTTGRIIRICSKGGIVAHVFPCANPRRAYDDETLPDIGDVPGSEGYAVGLEIARATALAIVDAHNNVNLSLPF
jgi:hypothetical protein